MLRTNETTPSIALEAKNSPNFLGMRQSSAVLLKQLNSQFLGQHDRTALSSLDKIDHVIVFNGHLSLYQKDEKQPSSYRKVADEVVAPEYGPYTQVKEISHLILLILEILHDNGLTIDQKQMKLQLLINQLSMINADIPASSEINIRQKEILTASIEFLSAITTLKDLGGIYLNQMISKYMEKVKPAIEFNRQFATNIQLHNLDSIIKKWIIMNNVKLDQSRVIITGAHGPRDGLIEMQYFLDLYRRVGIPNAENNAIYFVEQLPQHFGMIKIEKDLIESFLAISERNKIIGNVFANDQRFMFKDILSDKAPAVLSQLPKAPGENIKLFARPTAKCPMRKENATMPSGHPEVRSHL